MKKISDLISIEIWKEIANIVQRLNITSRTSIEFSKNLEELNQLLSNLGIYLEMGEPIPKQPSEIGISSLLEAIYSSDFPMEYKKAGFYEKIYQLFSLGVQNVQFLPVNFPTEISDLKVEYLKENGVQTPSFISKCYTDGYFMQKKPSDCTAEYYSIYNLHNANYIINIKSNVLSVDKADSKSYVISRCSDAIVKNFNGSFPCREELVKLEFPKFKEPEKYAKWKGTNLPISYEFEELTKDTAVYQGHLTMKNKQYYYR